MKYFSCSKVPLWFPNGHLNKDASISEHALLGLSCTSVFHHPETFNK